jgi:hypothetical protein
LALLSVAVREPSNMKIAKLSSLFAAFVVLLTGCAGPISKTSKMMQPVVVAPSVAPPGKSLVYIHRPRAYQGHPLYTGVWDSKTFVADLGNGHSVAYPCEPGQHYFINRSVELVGVVEAQLLPDKTYDLWVDTAGAFIASFKLKPVKPGSKQAALVPKWSKEHRWITPGETAAEHEQDKSADIDQIIQDFVLGKKRNRLQHLAPEDHR